MSLQLSQWISHAKRYGPILLMLTFLIHVYGELFGVYYTLTESAVAQKQLCKQLQADMVFPQEHVAEMAERCHYIQKNHRSLVRNPYLKLEHLLQDTSELEHYVKDVYYRAGGRASGRFASLLRNASVKTREILANGWQETDREGRSQDLALMELEALERIDRVQSPPVEDCGKTRVLYCESQHFFVGWGFGSRLNYLVVCLAAALATGRRMVFNPRRYLVEDYMLPYTATCLEHDQKTILSQNPQNFPLLTDGSGDEPILRIGFPQFPKMEGYEDSYPPNFPAAFGDPKELSEVWHDPYHWYAGVLTQYLYRLKPEVEARFDKRIKAMGIDLSTPLVGIQLRRTDIRAIREVPSVFKYMVVVEEHYERLEAFTKTEIPRRVFVATDEIETLDEIRANYPEYEVIANATAIKDARLVGSKWDSHIYAADVIQVENIVFDIWLLAKLDLAVSVFSSNIGRLIYQLRVSRLPDAKYRTVSVDAEPWFLNGHARSERFRAELANEAVGQLAFEAGDVIEELHHWDYGKKVNHGLNYGKNVKTGRVGLVPWYKLGHYFPEDENVGRNDLK